MPTEKSEEKETKAKKLTQAEFEKRILELGKTGLTSEKVGEALRKEEIHPADFEKKISKIHKENDSYTNPDLKNVEEKLARIEKHIEKNKQDKRAIRERSRIFSQLRKLKIYHN